MLEKAEAIVETARNLFKRTQMKFDDAELALFYCLLDSQRDLLLKVMIEAKTRLRTCCLCHNQLEISTCRKNSCK